MPRQASQPGAELGTGCPGGRAGPGGELGGQVPLPSGIFTPEEPPQPRVALGPSVLPQDPAQLCPSLVHHRPITEPQERRAGQDVPPCLITGMPLYCWHPMLFCGSGWKKGSLQVPWDRTRVHCHPLYPQCSSINSGEHGLVSTRKRRTWGR